MEIRHPAFGLADDAPLTNPADDRLGYDAFARHLAEVIYTAKVAEGVAFSLNGPWGSGKTTIVNFTCQRLSKKKDAPQIIRFNPWWFSSKADLAESFFYELVAAAQDRRIQRGLGSWARKLIRRMNGVSLGYLGFTWSKRPWTTSRRALPSS